MTNKNLQELVEMLRLAKISEANAVAIRLDIEKSIYVEVEADLKDKGVNNFPGGLKVTTGYTSKWDMDALKEMYENKELEVWPFEVSWKPDNKLINSMEKLNKENYAKLTKALTLTPKKPSFVIQEKE